MLLCTDSLVAVSGGYSLAVVHGLLVVVASPVLEPRLSGIPAAAVAVHGLSCSMAHRIFLDQGLKPCHLRRTQIIEPFEFFIAYLPLVIRNQVCSPVEF